jgi:hypothetical protein
MNTLRLVPVEASFRRYLVELDGKDISKYVSEISFTLKAGQAADVCLHLAPLLVEIPSELEACVIAKKDGEE